MESDEAPRVSVVIPHYQRESGILRSTVQSILAQTSGVDYEIIVVDDGSPVHARAELDGIDNAEGRLRIVEQPNRGPGAARNAGLERVPRATSYVALVDSDDRWVTDFLGDAMAAMEAGYDLFFGNSRRVGIEDTRFDWGATDGLNLDPAAHEPVDTTRDIHAFKGDFFDFAVYRSNIIGPSTLLYRFDRARALRYDPTIFNGQDRLFKLHLAKAVRAIAFSPTVYAHEGRGVNIFDSAGWGTPGSLRFLASYIELAKTIPRELALTPAQRRHVRGQLRRARRDFIASLLHLLRGRQPVDRRIVARTLRADPGLLLLTLPAITRAVAGRARGTLSR